MMNNKEKIQKIMQLGYTKKEAEEALTATNGNWEDAIRYLMLGNTVVQKTKTIGKKQTFVSVPAKEQFLKDRETNKKTFK